MPATATTTIASAAARPARAGSPPAASNPRPRPPPAQRSRRRVGGRCGGVSRVAPVKWHGPGPPAADQARGENGPVGPPFGANRGRSCRTLRPIKAPPRVPPRRRGAGAADHALSHWGGAGRSTQERGQAGDRGYEGKGKHHLGRRSLRNLRGPQEKTGENAIDPSHWWHQWRATGGAVRFNYLTGSIDICRGTPPDDAAYSPAAACPPAAAGPPAAAADLAVAQLLQEDWRAGQAAARPRLPPAAAATEQGQVANELVPGCGQANAHASSPDGYDCVGDASRAGWRTRQRT